MAPNTVQKLLIGSGCVAVIALAFVIGYSLPHDKGGSEATAATPDAAATNAPVAPAVAANDVPTTREPIALAATAPATRESTALAATAPATRDAEAFKTVDLTDWQFTRNGCTVEQNGSAIHIAGTNDVDGWGHANRVTTTASYPVRDFELSADLIMPKLKGPGQTIAYLQATEADNSQIVLQYFAQSSIYVVRWWTSSGQVFSRTTMAKFGDEAKKSHRLKLKYDVTTHRATGWADDELIGNVEFELKGDLRFDLGVSAEKKGNDIDVTFDHPSLTIGGKTGATLDKLP